MQDGNPVRELPAVPAPSPTPQQGDNQQQDRVVVTGFVSHQGEDAEVVSTASSWERVLLTQQQPFRRRTKIGEDWVPLEHGWLDRCSVMVVENNEGQRQDLQPTSGEAAAIASRVLEIGLKAFHTIDLHEQPQPFSLVPPGEDVRFSPPDLSRLFLRCRSGQAHVTICLYPE